MNKKLVRCVCLAQHFETLWAYYCQSDGALYSKECKETAIVLCEAIGDISITDPGIVDPSKLGFAAGTDCRQQVGSLKKWGASDAPYPFEGQPHSSFLLFVLITGIKNYIMGRLNLQLGVKSIWSSEQAAFTANTVRWAGQFPPQVIGQMTKETLFQMSSADTIAVIADIRRSQDLMTYATNADSFSTNIAEFMVKSRELTMKNMGVFDKFTGDGFVAYFNEHLCTFGKTTLVDSFVRFAHEEMAFAQDLFRRWEPTIRKLPNCTIGLAIGADLGKVSFRDIANQFVAVGDAIVWAARMAEAAQSKELVVNNILFHRLSELKGLTFEDVSKQTKSGESFLGRKCVWDSGPM
jgi:class 3 adenylate cyclase